MLSLILLIVSVLSCVAMIAGAPVVAVFVLWLGLSAVIALVFGACAVIGDGRRGGSGQ